MKCQLHKFAQAFSGCLSIVLDVKRNLIGNEFKFRKMDSCKC